MKSLQIEAKKYYQNTINNLRKWITINSVYDEKTITQQHPFGNGVAKALEYIAILAEEDGFEVDRCDGYCTEISYGQGPLIAIYAHCDVVPVSGEWKFDPFGAVIENDIMYGRGTSDDKGPAMAAYYAIKMLKDLDLIKDYRVSLVIGGNEESGSRCLEYYFNNLHKPYPSYGFTPDGDFPLIYGEKAIATFKGVVENDFERIISLKAGVVTNSVADKAVAELKESIEVKLVEDYCAKNKLHYELQDNILTFKGKASHGSLPQEGINAGLHMLIFLGQTFDYPQLVSIGNGFLDGEGKNINLYYSSELLHQTTYNIGIINYERGKLEYYINFRYPENVDCLDILKKLNSKGLGDFELLSTADYLLVDPESKMIKVLMKCYQEVTGDYISKPMAIGGGTYAKESKNTVAFGSHFVGREDNIHDANEKIHLSDLTTSIAIYAEAIKSLGELSKEGE